MGSFYRTGTITLTNGSKIVTGTGTAWVTALVSGGTIYPEAAGNPLPIASVDSNTQITSELAWKGVTGTYSYSLQRDSAYLQTLDANSQALAALIAALGSDIARLDSPNFTGSPAAPTVAEGNNSTRIATTAFVTRAVASAITALKGAVSASLDTLVELAANFSNYLPLTGGTLTGWVRAAYMICRFNGGINPNISMEDSSGVRRGVLAWINADGSMIVQNYAADGVSVINQIFVPGSSGQFTYNSAAVATADNIGNIFGGNVAQGSVGSIQMLAHATTGTTLVYGSNYAGSSLRYASLIGDNTGVAAGISGSSPAGTWKCLGTLAGTTGKYSISLFLRVL